MIQFSWSPAAPDGDGMDSSTYEFFEDVYLLIARARKHEAEYNLVANASGEASWWSVQEQRSLTGTYTSTLVIRCQQLKDLKPIAADLCNNLVHAPDQTVATLTRLNGRDNSGKLQFPWKKEDDPFVRSLSKLEHPIGRAAADSIRAAREATRPFLSHAHMAKKFQIQESTGNWCPPPRRFPPSP